MERGHLIKALVRAALDFHERALWRRVSSDSAFALRLSTETQPLFGVVLGNASPPFGLGLHRGNDALAQLRESLVSNRPEDVTSRWDILALWLDSPAKVTPAFWPMLREAGFEGRTAPVLFAKQPGANPRPLRRAEQEVMLGALQGILRADREGLFRPRTITTTGPATMWTLTLGGRLGKPEVRAKFEAHAATLTVPEVGPVAVPDDLRQVRRSNDAWFVSVPTMPARIAGDDRELRGILVATLGSGRILDLRATMGVDPDEVARVIFELCRGRGRSGPRLPARIDTDMRAVHDALAPALSELGIASDLMTPPPAFVEIVESLAEATSPEPSAGTRRVPDADDLDGWKEVERSLTELLAHEVALRGLNHPRVLAEFLGEEMTNPDQGAFHAAIQWVLFWRRTGRAQPTLVEKLLAEDAIPEPERTALRHRANSTLSMYRIESLQRGECLDLVDLLTGEKVRVHDRLASESADVGLRLIAATYPVGAFTFFSIMGPPTVALDDRAAKILKASGVTLTHEGLARKAQAIGRVWMALEQSAGLPMQFTNTDGEALLSIKVSFTVGDLDALLACLRARDDIDEHRAGEEYVWVKLSGEERTVLARLELIADSLVVEVNSEERLARVRAWLADVAGLDEVSATRRGFGERNPDADLPGPEPEVDAVVLAQVIEAIRARCLGWLDERIPALGGKTPRAAVRTATGRREVARLIHSYPDALGPDGPMLGVVPREEMLRELGLGP